MTKNTSALNSEGRHMPTRRDFLKTAAIGATALPAACRQGAPPAKPASGSGGPSRALLVEDPERPQPATFDRLSLEWHQARARLLQDRAGEKGADLIWLSSGRNVRYFTGLFVSMTERPFGAFIPVKELKAHFYYPYLDHDIVERWWHDDSEAYFDYEHADGGFPNRGAVNIGPPVDLTRWMLESMAKRGFNNATIGVDRPGNIATCQEMLPSARFIDISGICREMQSLLTPEEMALTQRAMNYGALGHAFARDYLIQHGTDLSDWQLRCETERFVMDTMMNDIKHDGRPHTAVGLGATVIVRAGVSTASPHPNQFCRSRIERGDPIYTVVIPSVAGYGGEQYRVLHLEPVPEPRRKMWEVNTESGLIQARESKAGVRCQDVAKVVHDYQVKEGMAQYIYHRPGHGQGGRGHTPPYIALGDDTVLVEGMLFSNEPGLYNVKDGYGYGTGDTVLVAKTKGIVMGQAPFTKEWCFIT